MAKEIKCKIIEKSFNLLSPYLFLFVKETVTIN